MSYEPFKAMSTKTTNIEFVDTTLREGFQSAQQLFRKGASPHDYAEIVTDLLNVSFVEIYGPEIYYTKADYESLVQQLASRLQLYCGVVDKFNPLQKLHINDLHKPRLSFTVIDKKDTAVRSIETILNEYPSASLRLGLECVGSSNTTELTKLLKKLAQLDRIAMVTLSDSNGIMTPLSLTKLIESLPQHMPWTLGFHLHNDSGMAVANTLAAISISAKLGIDNISFDYTYNGLGERYGLLSLQELVAIGQFNTISNPAATIKKLSTLFTAEALQFHSLPYMKETVHVAASHFDHNGKLRTEYRVPINKRARNG
jgi:isopropylmalate/homocitrate/citramalate synthase